MKKTTVSGVLLFSMIGFAGFAQKKDASGNIVNKEAFIAKVNRESKEKAAKLQRMAAVKGWPLVVNGEDGRISTLHDVTVDGYPLYYTTMNAGSALTSRANKLYPGGSAGLNLTGSGIRLGIWDGGHVRTSHITFSTARASNRDTTQRGQPNHPTHVAGTMVGNGGSNANAKGIAYEATLWAYDWDGDTQEMASAAELLVASNHSYGLDSSQLNPSAVAIYGMYNQDSQAVDEIVYNFPYYQPVYAAGNDGNSQYNPTKNGYDLLSQAGVAKNVLTVAAVHEVADYSAITPDQVTIANFSSYGPTDDFRIKPDIATKGVQVFSSVSTGDYDFANENGTSMAAPGITGVIGLLQQHYANLFPSDDGDIPPYMTAASVRGLLSHTADVIGDKEFSSPDAKTGWGLVNAERAAHVISAAHDQDGTVVFEQRNLAQGETYTFSVVANGVDKLRASIAWTDPAGQVASGSVDQSSARLVNNLNLKVTDASGEDFFPWRLNASFMNPIALRNAVNNVDNIEVIDVEEVEEGAIYTITVSHAGNLTNGAQDYTLTVTGIGDVNATNVVESGSLLVFPNPATDELNIRLSDAAFASGATAAVIDMQGRQVFVQNISGNQAKLSVAGLSAGIYFVKLNNAGKEQIKKIVVK